jgi:hypothetical protein
MKRLASMKRWLRVRLRRILLILTCTVSLPIDAAVGRLVLNGAQNESQLV